MTDDAHLAKQPEWIGGGRANKAPSLKISITPSHPPACEFTSPRYSAFAWSLNQQMDSSNYSSQSRCIPCLNRILKRSEFLRDVDYRVGACVWTHLAQFLYLFLKKKPLFLFRRIYLSSSTFFFILPVTLSLVSFPYFSLSEMKLSISFLSILILLFLNWRIRQTFLETFWWRRLFLLILLMQGSVGVGVC